MARRKDVVVVVRLSGREKARWLSAAADADMCLSELVRLVVRERLQVPVLPPVREQAVGRAG